MNGIVQLLPNPREQHFFVGGVEWQDYLAIGKALRDRPRLRLTYDRGMLEFMTTSPEHEIYRNRLGRLLDALSEECGLPIVCAGNMTFQRQDLARGFEPDNCYWIAHEPQMRGRLDWNPTADPPPDLAVEIEVSRSAADRLSIYAGFRIPEVWRFNRESIRIEVLGASGNYQESSSSLAFPGISVAGIVPFLQLDPVMDSLRWMQSFRDWVREQRKTK